MREQALSRRELYREQTRGEIMQIGLHQIADGGAEALSLNAIAKEMAVSGAALYRYFASRDELLAALVVQAYQDLAQTLEAAAAERHEPGPAWVRTAATAYRAWALAQPHRYRLIFSTRLDPGRLASAEIVLSSQRSMDVFLRALGSLPPRPESTGRAVSPALATQLEAWHQRSPEPALPPETLRLGMTCWTRLHGIMSLELNGHLDATNIDPSLLYRAEVEDLIG